MSGTVPPDYKHALITTIIKKHSLVPEMLNNYHSISNLTIFSKTLERVVLYIYISNIHPILNTALHIYSICM